MIIHIDMISLLKQSYYQLSLFHLFRPKVQLYGLDELPFSALTAVTKHNRKKFYYSLTFDNLFSL